MKLLQVDTIQVLEDKFAKYFSDMERKQEEVDLTKALGRYLAEDVFADMDAPSFRRSVVDGYAVIGADTFGAGESIPVFLESVGSVHMGEEAALTIASGETAYVPTGGMIPEGADAMVMVEYIDRLGDNMISVNKPAAPNENIMNIGDDFRKGEQFFSKGHRISAKDIGLLAACGKGRVAVYRKPMLSVISTGDELVEAGEKPDICQVRDINAYAIAAYAEALGAEVLDISIVRDDREACYDAVSEAMERGDMVVLSGGSSAGNMDFTKEVIASLGKPGVVTHGLAIRPGKPTIVGIFTDRNELKTVIGLPGHPLSSITVFDVVVGTFIKRYYLGNEEKPRSISAKITENIHAGEGRTTYQLVNLHLEKKKEECEEKNWLASPIRAKSGAIAQLAKAHGYVSISEGSEGLRAGETVDVILIE
ncbi:molybdopterin molybdotransferase MoeA [Bacillota bacterium]